MRHGKPSALGLATGAIAGLAAVTPDPGDLAIGRQFAVQLGAAVGEIVYTAVATWIILRVVSLVAPLRVDEHEEERGLDIVLHEESGYRL